jgi:hypothetical protein
MHSLQATTECCTFPVPSRTAYNMERTSITEETDAAVWRSYPPDELY